MTEETRLGFLANYKIVRPGPARLGPARIRPGPIDTSNKNNETNKVRKSRKKYEYLC